MRRSRFSKHANNNSEEPAEFRHSLILHRDASYYLRDNMKFRLEDCVQREFGLGRPPPAPGQVRAALRHPEAHGREGRSAEREEELTLHAGAATTKACALPS